jgi:hypothetical protein
MFQIFKDSLDIPVKFSNKLETLILLKPREYHSHV